MNPIKPNLLVLITRLFCRPVKHPGADLTSPHAVGSLFTIDPILRDFVVYVTAASDFPEGSTWNPGQATHRSVGRRHLEFHLPVSLRDFQSDLTLHMDELQRRPQSLAPLRAQDFYAKGKLRTTFDVPRESHLEFTPGSEWLRAIGYTNLRDLFQKTRNETVDWLSLVHTLGVPTKPLSTAEMGFLIDCVGDGHWLKGITVSVDTSSWPGQAARI